MKRRIKYTDEPMEFTVIRDFLPPPEVLRQALKKVKITVEVDAPTVQMFQTQAGRSPGDTERLMGKLLDLYASARLSDKR